MERAPRILVVDRSRLPRYTLARALRHEIPAATVTECASPKEALELLRQGQLFDMITTSLVFSDMDGLDLVRRLQTVARGHDTPVVVVSSEAHNLPPEEGFTAGISGYFDKSQGHSALVRFIHDFTQRNFVEGRVLYVEDDMTTATATQRLLEKSGLDVAHTTKAEQALEMLEQMASADTASDHVYFDLVLTDYFLKGSMTAVDLVHRIRSELNYSQQELPVLVITGNDDSQTQVKAFRAGANDFVTKPFIQEALISRIRSLLLIRKQYQAIRLQAAQMQRMSATDKLTGAYDRPYFLYHGEQMLNQLESQPLCVLNFGVDDLPAFNQRHGRPSGDATLKSLVEVARELLPSGAILSRFGGETFYALIPNCRSDQGQRHAEKLRRAMADRRPKRLEISTSVGLASGQEHKVERISDLIAAAEQALARARAGGSNQIIVSKGEPGKSAGAGEDR